LKKYISATISISESRNLEKTILRIIPTILIITAIEITNPTKGSIIIPIIEKTT